MKSTTCESCAEKFSYEELLVNGKEVFARKFCDECTGVKRTESEKVEIEETVAKRRSEFYRECPAAFDRTEVSRLGAGVDRFGKSKNPLEWNFGRTGLLLVGPTGATKTRTLWEILRKQKIHEGVDFISTTEIKVSLGVTRFNFSDSYASFLNKLCATPLLAIDDLGKAKYTDRVREALFHIVDVRTTNGRPMLCTTQFSGTELAYKFAHDGENKQDEMAVKRLQETAEAWVRRLREFCEPITMTARKEI